MDTSHSRTSVAPVGPPRAGWVTWALHLAALGLAVAIVPVWLALLRPVALGGPAGYTIVAGPSMSPTFENGDLAVTMQKDAYEVGDVVVYEVPVGEPGAGAQVIHRIVGGSEDRGFLLRGDNREGADPWRPRAREIVGEVRLTIPSGGDVLLFLRTGLGLAVLAGALALLLALAIVRGEPGHNRPARL